MSFYSTDFAVLIRLAGSLIAADFFEVTGTKQDESVSIVKLLSFFG